MRAFIVQVPGRLTRLHDRGFTELPPEGTEVMLDPIYRKALANGDIQIVEPVQAPAAEPPAPEPLEAEETSAAEVISEQDAPRRFKRGQD